MNAARTMIIPQIWSFIISFASLFDRISSWTGPSNHQSVSEKVEYSNGARDCVLVLDASGSMFLTDWKPSRLGAAQEAAEAFVKRLKREQPSSRVAIVAYGDKPQLFCSLTPARSPRIINQSIRRIQGLGCTNITDGLQVALGLLSASRRTSQVILLTDGHHNKGPSPVRIGNKLKQCAIIESVGIGGSPRDVDETLLKRISSAYPDGTKRYRWIGDKEQLVQHFHNLAGGITRA